MSLENPITPEAQFPLKYWFGKMDDADKLIIETDIFNDSADINLDVVFGEVRSQETARQVMNQFKDYLAMKKEGSASKADLKNTAAEILKFVDRAALPD